MAQKKTSTSSTSSAASEVSASDLKQRELFGQLPSASESRSAKLSCESIGPTRRSTTTSEPSTQIDLEELTSSAAGSHASRGPLLGSSEAQKMTEISGRKCCELLKLYKVGGSLAKMSEALLTSRWGSSAAFLTWKASDTKPSHLLFQLAPSMPRTDEIASGLWPTAQAWDGKRRPRKPDGKRGMALSDLAAPQMWPTPQHRDWKSGQAERYTNKKNSNDLNDAVRMWPTPTASDYKGSGPTVVRKDGKNRLNDRLDYATEQRAQNGGQLNPNWVEWLMGFPTGYTDLKPSEMPSSRKSLRKSGAQSSKRRADGRDT